VARGWRRFCPQPTAGDPSHWTDEIEQVAVRRQGAERSPHSDRARWREALQNSAQSACTYSVCNGMEHPLSIHEMRRRAPLHFSAKADNARFAAYVLWTMGPEARRRCAEQIGYDGLLSEAFFREASLALELMIKAVIAQRR
jgi:hypothetical protein